MKNFNTEDMTRIDGQIDIEVYRTIDPNYDNEETVILRLKVGEADIGFNVGPIFSKKLLKEIDK